MRAHFHVLAVLAMQNRVCQHRWGFCQYLQASWWTCTFMTNIWESRFALLANMHVWIWPSLHLPILSVARPDWMKSLSWDAKLKNEKSCVNLGQVLIIIRRQDRVNTTIVGPHQHVYKCMWSLFPLKWQSIVGSRKEWRSRPLLKLQNPYNCASHRILFFRKKIARTLIIQLITKTLFTYKR